MGEDRIDQQRRLIMAGLTAISMVTASSRAGEPKPATAARRMLKVEAKPAPIVIDAEKTAVIVVDMENDFGSKGGMFDLAGIDISGIQRAVAPTARVLAAARNARIRVVYLRMGYRADLSDLGTADSVNRVRHLHLGVGKIVLTPDGKESRTLIRDTWGTEIVSELKPQAEDLLIWKTRFSGFYNTDLDLTLKNLGIKHLIFTGCTTSICVESTVRDAMFRDYQSVLLADCMDEPIGHGMSRSNHEASLLTVEVLLGWVSSADRFVAALSA